jgi:hypothetical protein
MRRESRRVPSFVLAKLQTAVKFVQRLHHGNVILIRHFGSKLLKLVKKKQHKHFANEMIILQPAPLAHQGVSRYGKTKKKGQQTPFQRV